MIYKDYEEMNCWKTYGKALSTYIYNRVTEKEIAKDLSQELYIKIYLHCKKFDFDCEKAGVKNLKSWLFQTAHNTIADFYKNKFKEEKKSAAFIYPVNSEEEIQFNNNATELIAAQIEKLPAKYKIPLKMADIDGLKQHEIAERLSLTLSATKSRIQRGRLLLKSNLIEKGFVRVDDSGRLLAICECKNYNCC